MNYSWEVLWPRIVQVGGLAIVIYETLIEKLDRPSLLLLAGGMMGFDRIHKVAKKLGEK